jgi:hypothetical protein
VNDYIKQLQSALRSARSHVIRQQHHGRHEQDRADAVEWVTKYGRIDTSKQYDHPCNCVKCTRERVCKE